MNAEELFKRLKPVMGKKADELWVEYQLCPKDRSEIEGLLHLLAKKHLGLDFENRAVLLPPPPREKADGLYELGTVTYCGNPLYDFGLREHELIQHVAIFGRTGSGKTNVGFLLVKELMDKGKPFLIFDWKRNYRDIIPLFPDQDIRLFTVGRDISPFAFNPLIPPENTMPTIWLKKMIEIMCHVYWLGEGVAYLLQKAMDAVYQKHGVYDGNENYPTFRGVQDWLLAYKAKGRESQWMDSTVRVIGTLCYGEISRVLNSQHPSSLAELLKQKAILELDALTNSDKTFLIEALLLWIHHYRLQEKGRETFKHAILIEEAHHVLLRKKESKESITDIILREIRELGEAIILIDQHPSLISIPSFGNTYCTIAMNLKHGRDVNAIADAVLLSQEQEEYLGKLEVGQGIVKLQGRWHKPFLVEFPEFKVRKGMVTDEALKGKTVGFPATNEEISTRENIIEDVSAIPREDKKDNIKQEELNLMLDVIQKRTSGISERYKRLGWSVRQGDKILSSLLSRGFLTAEDVSMYKGRIKFLDLGDKRI